MPESRAGVHLIYLIVLFLKVSRDDRLTKLMGVLNLSPAHRCAGIDQCDFCGDWGADQQAADSGAIAGGYVGLRTWSHTGQVVKSEDMFHALCRRFERREMPDALKANDFHIRNHCCDHVADMSA